MEGTYKLRFKSHINQLQCVLFIWILIQTNYKNM